MQWRNALVVGTLMLGSGMGLVASTQQAIGSGLVATFIAVVPLLVAAWGTLFGGRPSRGRAFRWLPAAPASRAECCVAARC